jgi:hypothetical protein
MQIIIEPAYIIRPKGSRVSSYPPSASSGAGKLVDDATLKYILSSPKPSSYLLLSLSTVTSQ